MNIALDARWVFPQLSGIGAHTVELIRHLAAEDRDNRYWLLVRDAAGEAYVAAAVPPETADRFRVCRLSHGVFSLRNQWAMRGWLRRMKIDVYHSPNYMIPFSAFPRGRGARTRSVVTVHDLIPLVHPEFTPRALKTRCLPIFRLLLREMALRADLLLTVSETSRRDLLAHLPIAPERVRVIPNGVAADFRPAPRCADVTRVILYIGRLDPYKNVPGLVRAFARVRERLGGGVRLRVAGPPDERYPEARREAAALGVARAIEWAGYLDRDGLRAAYQQADVFALLSRYEGFGMPVLEAMACGTPVVCGRCAALEETAGDAALLVPPQDPDAAADALVRVLSDPACAAQLREQGLRRAAGFTWARAAALTRDAYAAAVQGRVR